MGRPSAIQAVGGSLTDVANHINKAYNAFTQLNHVWNSSNIPKRIKIISYPTFFNQDLVKPWLLRLPCYSKYEERNAFLLGNASCVIV